MLHEITPVGNFQSSESLSQAEIASGLTQLYPSRWNPKHVDFTLMLDHMRELINMNASFKQYTAEAWDTCVQNATPENSFVKTLQVPFTTEDVARRDQPADKNLDVDQAKNRMRFLYGLYHTDPDMWLDWNDDHVSEAALFTDAKYRYERAKREIDGQIETQLLNPNN